VTKAWEHRDQVILNRQQLDTKVEKWLKNMRDDIEDDEAGKERQARQERRRKEGKSSVVMEALDF
jgi:hypothetical protein